MAKAVTARDVWINPPPIPLTTAEMDLVFDLPYARAPHPAYADENGSHAGSSKIPAWEMIRFSVNIMRGCFGGCTFCSITEHEGRIIQSRSEDSIIKEIEDIRDKVTGFTGTVSDLGGPTANMYRLGCKSPEIEAACRKPSCVFPGICQNLGTDHQPLINIYRRGRALKGIKKILIGSGRALRPGRAKPGIRQGTGATPCRRLPQNCARAHRIRPVDEDDEARHWQLMTSSRRCLTSSPQRRAKSSF